MTGGRTAASVALASIAAVVLGCGVLSVYGFLLAAAIARLAYAGALAWGFAAVVGSNDRFARISGAWWVVLVAPLAYAAAAGAHGYVCGLWQPHTPTPMFTGFALSFGVPLAGAPFAVRGGRARRGAAPALVGCIALAALTWWQTDREGTVLGAATRLPPPALAVLLADGRPAEVERTRSFTWSGPTPNRPLRAAVWASRPDAVEVLLGHGADPLYEEHIHISLVADALARDDRRSAALLLRAGAGARPAAMAHTARRGDVDDVAWLLDQGADPGAAMEVAIAAHHDEVVELLLDRSVPLSGLCAAVQRGDEALVARLLARGADDAADALGCLGGGPDPAARLRLLRVLLATGADPNHDGGMPLSRAASFPDPALVRALLDAGADPLLGYALGNATGRSADDTAVLDELLARLDGRAIPTHQPATVAVRGGSVALLRKLLAAGVPADVPDQSDPPLCAAIASGSMAMVEVLLAAGADPGRDCRGRTARDRLTELGRADAGRDAGTQSVPVGPAP